MQLPQSNTAIRTGARLDFAPRKPSKFIARAGLAACLTVLLLAASGCQLTDGWPSPIEDRTRRSGDADGILPPDARELPPGEGQSKLAPSPIMALVDQANRLQQEGSSLQAEASLERAIRIAPQNGMVWMRLAEIQLASGKHEAAEQTARKSLLFLPPRGGDTQRAWLVIAGAREAEGDMAEARRIRRKWNNGRS